MQPVGTFPGNVWGFYDMHGNAAEWCLDAWHPYRGADAPPQPNRHHPGQAGRDLFVVRGGSLWEFDHLQCCSFARSRSADVAGNYRGLRIALAPTLK